MEKKGPRRLKPGEETRDLNRLLINTHLQVGAEVLRELLKPLQRFFVCKRYRTRSQPEKPLKRFQNATPAPHTRLKAGVNEKPVLALEGPGCPRL
jgi:hypothetical protein